MKIIQKATVKQVLTERSKEELLIYYAKQKRLLEQESDQLHFEKKKVERKNKFQSEQVGAYFDREIDLRHEKIKLVDFQIEQLETLPLGSEIKERDIETLIEINVGDAWDESLFQKTIVVRDGTIIEIR
ncbi:YlqD family protein [Listeria costaricensis]|uniref:YlqD family protein n=1 Tax=Listeria costaricensis TaxID=2026604 RepID=UPI000C08A420|nr:YlqD family protein [Listeria costaricensis]